MLHLIELKLKHWCVSPKINHLSFKISAASRPPPVNKCNPELCRMTKDGELATCKKQVSSKIAQIMSCINIIFIATLFTKSSALAKFSFSNAIDVFPQQRQKAKGNKEGNPPLDHVPHSLSAGRSKSTLRNSGSSPSKGLSVHY